MKHEDVVAMIAHGRRPEGTDRRRWSCPDESRIAAFAEGWLTGRRFESTRGHVGRCRNCRETVAFLARMESEEDAPPVPEALFERARRLGVRPVPDAPGMPWGVVAAGSAAVVVVAAIWLGRDALHPGPLPTTAPPPGRTIAPGDASPKLAPGATAPGRTSEVVPPRLRGSGAPEETLAQLSPPPNAILTRNQLAFRWSDVPGALYYDVRIVTVEGDLLWEARVRDAVARPPEDVRLVPGRRYFAWIRAALRDGRTVASPARAFTIRDP